MLNLQFFLQIEQAVSLSLGYDAASIEEKRKEVLAKIATLETMSKEKIKKVSLRCKQLEEENTNLQHELEGRPSSKEWRDMELRNESLLKALKSKAGRGEEDKTFTTRYIPQLQHFKICFLS